MIKKFFWFVVVLSFVVIIKFFVSDYTIYYDTLDYKVKEVYADGVMYFEVVYEDVVFNYVFYDNRKITKKRVKSIKKEESSGSVCLTPEIKGFDSYTVCSNGDSLASLDVINNKELSNNNKNDFYFSDVLDKNEFILIWKYDGFYYLSKDGQKSINIFDKDRYSNDLMFQVDNYLVFPKYGSDYFFSDFVVLDMTDGNYKSISSDYQINYSSQVVGNNKNSIYIFDNKDNKLYEVNYKKRKVKLIGDSIKGYVKFVNGKKKNASLNDYLKDKVTYFEKDKSIINVEGNYFNYVFNENVKFKYFNDSNVRYVNNYEENLYFVSSDNLYKFDNNKTILLVHYFEFNFNNKDIVYVYNK